jgi:hypothetical protein
MSSRNGGNGFTAAQCIEAAQNSRGFVTSIAKRLGCSRTYVYTLAKKYPTFQQAIDDEREGLKDFAEGKLMGQIDEGNIAAIIFYLKTQAKDRGYVERQEITGADGGSITVNWDDTSNTD